SRVVGAVNVVVVVGFGVIDGVVFCSFQCGWWCECGDYWSNRKLQRTTPSITPIITTFTPSTPLEATVNNTIYVGGVVVVVDCALVVCLWKW
ncbi:hypothetical protein NDU88_008909, partial [Pleurodeles waltl]